MKADILGDYPAPNLPYLQDGDITVTQSNAIVRYVARAGDLLGNTPEEATKVQLS